MTNLQSRQEKIQTKRKQTPWREFVMEICSRCSLNIYKNEGIVSRFPETKRIRTISRKEFFNKRDTYSDLYNSNYIDSHSFLEQIQELFIRIPLPVLFGSGESENCDYSDMG